jgi:hypothetical protein
VILEALGAPILWSAQHFTLIPPPPTPAIEKPEIDTKEVRFRWKSLGEGVTYRFQMSTDNEFKNIVMDKKVELPEITLPKPKEAGMVKRTYEIKQNLDVERLNNPYLLHPEDYDTQQELFEAIKHWWIFKYRKKESTIKDMPVLTPAQISRYLAPDP